MKKLLPLIVFAFVILTSCNNDDALELNGNNEVLYSVNFKTKSRAGFTVETTPSKSLDSEKTLQVVVYKETGEVVSNKSYNSANIKEMLQEDNSILIKVDLPAGNYHIAFAHFNETYTPEAPAYSWYTQNFYNDFITQKIDILTSYTKDANVGLFFETIDISLPNDIETQNVILEPMWSTISLELQDNKSFLAPDEANYLLIDIQPYAQGLNVSTKLAKAFHEQSHYVIEPRMLAIDDIQKMDTLKYDFNISKTDTVNNNLKITFQYFKDANRVDTVGLKEYIDLDTNIKNGINYTIKGKIGLDSYGHSTTLKLGGFKEETIKF